MAENSSVNIKFVLIFVTGAVLSFAIGFILSNNVNRQEQDRLREELARARTVNAAKDASTVEPKQTASGDDAIPTLTDEQLKNAVAKADASPGDLELQKKVGQGLYIYAREKGNASILPDVARILKRAHDLDPKDYKTTMMAGEAQFYVAGSSGDAKALNNARKLYEAALVLQPDDVNARTSLGLTYFYDKPSDPQRAMREYRRVLQSDPRQEMALQSLAAALIETGNFVEAAQRLDELEKVNSANQEISSLRAQLEQKKNASKELK